MYWLNIKRIPPIILWVILIAISPSSFGAEPTRKFSIIIGDVINTRTGKAGVIDREYLNKYLKDSGFDIKDVMSIKEQNGSFFILVSGEKRIWYGVPSEKLYFALFGYKRSSGEFRNLKIVDMEGDHKGIKFIK